MPFHKHDNNVPITHAWAAGANPSPGNSFFRRLVRESRKYVLGRAAEIWAFAAKPGGGKYELSHLAQPPSQYVGGCVQDDEALLLFAVVRGMRMRAILEVGGLSGYSALNFARALPPGEGGFIATVDINPVRKAASCHESLQKPAGEVTADDLAPLFAKYGLPPRLDLIFFDAHVYEEQTRLLATLKSAGIADGKTVIALHDTCPHPKAFHTADQPVRLPNGDEGFVGFPQEMHMVEDLKAAGYCAFQLHPRREHIGGEFEFRHGITLMQMHGATVK